MSNNDLEKIHIVGASAGSGKTFDLCARYHCALNEKDITPDQIIATTFTRKAAGELKQRLREKLLKKGDLKRALAVEDGRIGTVHSVCFELLSELSFLVGFSPELEILPEETEDWAFKLATDHIVAEYREKHADVFNNLAIKQEDWSESVKRIAVLARANKIKPGALKKQAEQCKKSIAKILPKMEAKDSTIADLDKQIATKIKAILPGMETGIDQYDSDPENKEKTQDNVKGARESVAFFKRWRSKKQHSWPSYLEFSGRTLGKSLPNKKDLVGNLDEIKALARQHTLTNEFKADILTCIKISFDCAADVIKRMQDWKEEQGLVDYVDMETMTEELLSGGRSPEVKAALHGRIKEIFVDEFQDTSPIQLQLFLALAKLAEQSTWIGDTKQAIYGFRGTDSELMEAVTRYIRTNGGGASSLEHSWRSRPGLVSFTNSFFSAAFTNETQVALEAARRDMPDQTANTLRVGILAKGKLEIGWESLAQTIMSLVEVQKEKITASQEVEIINGEDNHTVLRTTGLRDARYGDIAILCRSNEHCKDIAKVLTQSGIPVRLAPAGLEKEPQARLCLAAYYCAIHTNAVLPLLEMARLLGADDNPEWLKNVIDSPQKLKELPCFGDIPAKLESLNKRLPSLSPFGALQEIVSLLDKHVSLIAGETVHRILAKTRSYEDDCSARKTAITHEGCLDYLNNEEFKEALEDSNENAVSLLTYHKAKGLEWPIVFLADLDKFLPNDAELYFGARNLPLCDKEFVPQKPLENRRIHYWPWPYGAKKTVDSSHPEDLNLQTSDDAERIRQSQTQELLRLLYVGMTRARDILYLVYKDKDVEIKPDKKSPKGKQEKKSKDKKETANILVENGWITGILPKGTDWQLPDLASDNPCFKINGVTLPCTIVRFDEQKTNDAPDAAAEADAATLVERPARPSGKAPEWPEQSYMPSTLPAVKAQEAPKPQNGDIFDIKNTDIKGDDEDAAVPTRNDGKRGTLYHAWLAQAVLLKDTKEIKERAESFVEQWKGYAEQWKVALPKADALVALRKNLLDGLDTLARAKGLQGEPKFRAEWPIAFTRTNEVQLEEEGKTQQVESVVSGFIDLLAIYENGTVIVDHKFKTSAKTTAETAAGEYASQLAAYREALTKVDGFGDNILCCLHMPVQGQLVVVPLK